MEKEEIIKEIDRMLNEIEHESNLDLRLGLCHLTGLIFRKYMSEQAKKQGLNYSPEYLWWYDNLKRHTMTISEWYAPRIKFLENWKKELLES